MRNIDQLEKKQIGLRLPKYLVDEIDEVKKRFNVNRTEVIIEAIKSYVEEQKNLQFYNDFEKAAKELKNLKCSKNNNSQTLNDLIYELENN